ncbi:ENTH domain-containing protein [Plasmodiophora brassicae]|uniref:ENTH domain-containing protein n=1 Tax=Plasmodiophora brassicae TaxID=37360 RepID=A0A0G4IGZ0_PLABS|nr:hypothetical protein PBRA_000155 [Plasmodiophora brassicae]SPQ96719.1 unnamed protein product [Plasmodiophora brassicae]
MQIGNLNVNVNSIVNKVRDQIEQYRGSEIEKKVKEATSSANWGVTGQVKEDIARATYDYTGYSEVMGILWKRMGESGKNWRMVFKSLDLLEYLLKRGSERVVSEARERQYQIRTLKDFHFSEQDGRDKGGGIREKSRAICELLNDDAALKAERQRARTTQAKYTGLGSYGYAASNYRGFDSFDMPREEPAATGRWRDEEGGDAQAEIKKEKKKNKKKKKPKKGSSAAADKNDELSDDVLSESEEEEKQGTAIQYGIPDPLPPPKDKKKKKRKKKQSSQEVDQPIPDLFSADAAATSTAASVDDILGMAFSAPAPAPSQAFPPVQQLQPQQHPSFAFPDVRGGLTSDSEEWGFVSASTNPHGSPPFTSAAPSNAPFDPFFANSNPAPPQQPVFTPSTTQLQQPSPFLSPTSAAPVQSFQGNASASPAANSLWDSSLIDLGALSLSSGPPAKNAMSSTQPAASKPPNAFSPSMFSSPAPSNNPPQPNLLFSGFDSPAPTPDGFNPYGL